MNQTLPHIVPRKEIWGWCMYDFANSGFATTILAVIFNKYFATVVAGGEQGVVILGTRIPGAAFFGYVLAFSYTLSALMSPVLGAIADFSRSKKRFWFFFFCLGTVFSSLLYFVHKGNYLMGACLFALANLGFSGGNVFYNAFLPEITTKESMGRVSGLGWGLGYLGGGLLLALNLVMLEFPQLLGFSPGAFTVHHCFVSVSLWWGVFSIPTFLWVRERGKARELEPGQGYMDKGFQMIWATMKKVRQYREFSKFLLSYLFFNDGIETIIVFASIFGAQVVGMDNMELILFFLTIQGTAFLGSLLWGYLTDRLGGKRALMLTFLFWVTVVLWAYKLGFLGDMKREYWVIGILAGMVLGGSQATARSIAGSFIPKENSAEFFGFYNICGRFAAIFGPVVYSLAISLTGDMRLGILALLALFIIGLALLLLVNEERGIEESLKPVS